MEKPRILVEPGVREMEEAYQKMMDRLRGVRLPEDLEHRKARALEAFVKKLGDQEDSLLGEALAEQELVIRGGSVVSMSS